MSSHSIAFGVLAAAACAPSAPARWGWGAIQLGGNEPVYLLQEKADRMTMEVLTHD